MAYKFAIAAVDSLEAGETNAIMVFRDGTFGHLPIATVVDSKYKIDPSLIKLCTPLCC
jgi:hypothetical protein